MVKIHHRRIAVVLGDDILHRAGQAVRFRQRHAVPGMGGNDGGGHVGIGMLMHVHAVHLVFGKIAGALELADIVVIGADPGQKGVGPDGLGRRFGQVGHDGE